MLRRLLAAACLLAPAIAATAGATPLQPLYRVCSHALPPHSMPNPDHTPGGMASEILLAVAQRLNWQLDVRYLPWLRARAQAESGACDLIYTVLKKPEYEAFAVYPREPLSERRNVLIVRRGRGIAYDGNLETFMRRYSIGTYHDKAVSPLFDQLKHAPWARVDYAPTPEQNVEKLLQGRFDAIAENSATARYLLQHRGAAAAVEMLEPPLLVTPAYVAFSKRGRALGELAAFERELGRFRATPAYRALVARYEGNGSAGGAPE